MKRRTDVLLKWYNEGFYLWCFPGEFPMRVKNLGATATMEPWRGKCCWRIEIDPRYDREAVDEALQEMAEEQGLSFESANH